MLAALEQALSATGMALRGGFAPESDDDVPFLDGGVAARTVLLVGNIGGAMWPAFAKSGARERFPANPLDCWTRETLGPIARSFGATAVYPFLGPPYYPFQRWAARAEPVHVSPLRIFIHPVYGLWHAYRAAFLFADRLGLPARADAPSPCATCREQPCLTACPVGAFGVAGLDDLGCASHVDGRDGSPCRDAGCLARRACPVGREFSYPPEQMAFHMAAFLAPRRHRLTPNLNQAGRPTDCTSR